jgi:hypothetical protein
MSFLVRRQHAWVILYSPPCQNILTVSRHFQEGDAGPVNKLGRTRVLIASSKGRRLPS